MLTEKLKKFFKNKYNLILVGILAFAFVLRIRYLFIDQAVWWDAADYLTFAKIIGGKLVYYTSFDFNPRRPFFLASLWGLLYRLGLGEVALRFTEFLFSFGIVILTYLIGKELYNKTIGLIASFIMSGFYLMLFFTARLMTDIPCVFFLMLTMLMFLKGFVKNEGRKYVILTGVFAGLAILTRAASIFTFPFFFLFIFMTRGLKILKNKNFWLAIIIGLIIFSPFLAFIHFKHGGDAIGKFLGISYGRELGVKTNVFIQHLDSFPLYYGVNEKLTSMLRQNVFWENFSIIEILKVPFLILFAFGLFYMIGELILGYDIFVKNEKLKKNLFVILWFLIPFLGLSFFAGFEPRQMMITFPAAFIIISLFLVKLYKFISKYNKVIALVLVGLILLYGVSMQANYGHKLIKVKQMSYYPVKQAGLWIKENTDVDDIIISASTYQNMYYSERDTLHYYKDEEKMTEKEFDEFVKKVKPKYMVISIFEPGFSPTWNFDYQERHSNIKPVQVYTLDGKNPALIIYEFISY